MDESAEAHELTDAVLKTADVVQKGHAAASGSSMMALFEHLVDSESVPAGTFGRFDRILLYGFNALSTAPAEGVSQQQHLLNALHAMGKTHTNQLTD